MTRTKITASTGNVYADLGFQNPEEHALKAELVRRISIALKAQSLTQTEAAKRLSIGQPDVSKMLSGQFRQFSVERLMRFLVALGHDVKIVVEPARAAKSKAAQLVVAGEFRSIDESGIADQLPLQHAATLKAAGQRGVVSGEAASSARMPMERFMAKGTKIGRDARDGRFIPVDVAIRRPSTTTVETIKKSK